MSIGLKAGGKDGGEEFNISVRECDRTKICYVVRVSIFLMNENSGSLRPR